MPPRVLFILKKRDVPFYDTRCGNYNTSSGLLNSAKFVHDMLVSEHIESKMVEVVDNNCIDREVTQYRPTHVIIEAFWVVPKKFEILHKLHPTVKWIIRSHSEIPFLANEGVAMEWMFKYVNYPNVILAFNTERTTKIMRNLLDCRDKNNVISLTNYYPPVKTDKKIVNTDGLRIGCFGAIRLLKNQLNQAVAAVEYGRKHNVPIEFHINGNRLEGQGDTALKNIRNLFKSLDSPDYKLVEHQWYSHEDFLNVVDTMDIGLQVSFTETFNIVAADFVTRGIPIVVSKEIGWVNNIFQADCTNVCDIVEKMETALWWKTHLGFFDLNLKGLKEYSKTAKKHWFSLLTD